MAGYSPMSAELCPVEEWIVTADEFIDVSRFLADTEFQLWKEFEADYPGRKLPTGKIRWGSSHFTAFKQFGQVCATLAAVAVLAQVIEAVQTYEPVSTRRKRRTWLCVSSCLGIITAARDTLDAMETRALESEESPRRKARTFRSRS